MFNPQFTPFLEAVMVDTDRSPDCSKSDIGKEGLKCRDVDLVDTQKLRSRIGPNNAKR